MTDWWAKINDEGEPASRTNTAAMIRAQNDLYMVVSDSASNSGDDNLPESLLQGNVTRAQLVRAAKNICKAILRSPVMARSLGRISDEERQAEESCCFEDQIDFDIEYQSIDEERPLDLSHLNTQKGTSALFGITYRTNGIYSIMMRVRAEGGEMAQIPMSVFVDGRLRTMITVNGTSGNTITVKQDIGPLHGGSNYLKLYFGQSGMEIEEIKFICTAANPE